MLISVLSSVAYIVFVKKNNPITPPPSLEVVSKKIEKVWVYLGVYCGGVGGYVAASKYQ